MSAAIDAAALTAESRHVLVTGANGQIGLRLIKRLARSNPPIRVRAVVRSEQAANTLEALPEAVRPQVSVIDYHDSRALAQIARDCEFAVHLVGILKETSSSRYEDAHEFSTLALAQAAAGAGMKRIVYLSIVGSSTRSDNACLASKGRAEQILIGAKTPALILRVPMVIGPGDSTANIVRREALARVLPLVAGGRAKTQPIYADDVVDAIIAGLDRDGLDDQILELAGPESLSQREFIERAAALYGRRPRIVSIPKGFALFIAGIAERFSSKPPITRCALEVILGDDDVDPDSACRRLGISLTPLDEILRNCVGPDAECASAKRRSDAENTRIAAGDSPRNHADHG